MAITQSFLIRIYNSKFVRNVALVASGTAGAQAIAMAFSPIITRFYGPEAFGLLGTFMAMASFFTPIAALSYPTAIVLPKEDAEARGIARLSLYIALGMASLVTLVLLIAGSYIVEVLQVQEISHYILLIPLVILFSAWLQTSQQWLIRKKQFKITARVAIIQALLVNGIKTIIGFFKPLAAVLILVYTLGSSLHASMLSYGGKKADGNNRKNNKVHAPIWHLAKIYYDFPLYRTPQNFLHSVSQSLPVLMLTAFFGPASAGFYVLCTRVVGMPSQLVAKAVGDVFYPRISEAAHNRENLGGLILKATAALAGLAIFPFGILAIFGPLLFAFVFGKEWSVAGQYAQWLALYMFLNFVNKACVVAIPVLALQGFLLSYEMTAIAVRVIGLTLGFYVYHSALIAIALFSIAGFIMYIFLIWYVLAKSRTGKKR